MASIAPNPACYRILGRADEIARMTDSPQVLAEHLFLAMIHDDKQMDTQVLAGLVDLNLVEAAIMAIMEEVRESPDQPPKRLPPPELAGFRVAAEMGESYVGTWHLFLGLIRDRESVPARALARLVDLAQVEAAVLDVMDSPAFNGFKNSFGDDELLLPEGLELDSALINAIAESRPAGAAFGFNWRMDDGRPWIMVGQPGNPRDALNAALARLGRPPLS